MREGARREEGGKEGRDGGSEREGRREGGSERASEKGGGSEGGRRERASEREGGRERREGGSERERRARMEEGGVVVGEREMWKVPDLLRT